jgi:hypothetical protein
MATVPVSPSKAQQVSHAVITAAMKVHTELARVFLKVLIPPACNMNSLWREFGLRRRSACPSFIAE